MPEWQKPAVSQYFAGVYAQHEQVPTMGYPVDKRGYPDVSALANNYVVALNGSWVPG
jgi:hypothetical protein